MHHHQQQQRVIAYYLMNIYLCEDSYEKQLEEGQLHYGKKHIRWLCVWTKTEDKCDLALEIT